jgi:anaerobic ribonucleoside-triphosphate reductase activating protein
MNYSDIKIADSANGEGMRISLFVSGCRNHCKNCFNPETWNFNNGFPYTYETVNEILGYLDHDYIQGLTILGGEPLEQENALDVFYLIKEVNNKFNNKKDIWLYTGFIFENLIDEINKPRGYNSCNIELLNSIDVLVEGPYIDEQRDISLKFRGSKNQRILDSKKSIELRKPIIIEKYM